MSYNLLAIQTRGRSTTVQEKRLHSADAIGKNNYDCRASFNVLQITYRVLISP